MEKEEIEAGQKGVLQKLKFFGSSKIVIIALIVIIGVVILWGIFSGEKTEKQTGEIPPEGELKRLLIERNFVEDETAFKSHAGLEIRYFTSENRFVFVAPGRNGRYDTPEGYEAIEATEDTGDDFVRFDRVLRKREDRNEQKDKVGTDKAGTDPILDRRDDQEGEREKPENRVRPY